MKTKILALGAIVTTFAVTSYAAEPLLSPRAAGNQIRVVSSTTPAAPTISIVYVDKTPATLSPRAAGNDLKVVKGAVADTNPALTCRQNMNGTPRAVTECSSHANMPGCATIAPLK
ncbi:MAG TPA: hypothetical protein VF988_06505 [Verrucomicrobiae bacterium]